MKMSGEIRRGTELIFMVESDRAIKDLARDMFRRYGYRLLSACDRQEAVSLYREHAKEIAVVLIDALSDCEGGELFRSIRSINPGARVIATSGAPQNRCFLDMLSQGVAGYLRKPYRMTELLNLVGCVLSAK